MEEHEQTETRMLLIGEKVPDFEAVTTDGPIKFSEWAKGSWVILFSHPADFTPVCTTEFMAFADIYPDLQKRNVKLLGLSIDSIYSHIAWLTTIKEKLGKEIPFSIIEDLSMNVAKKYGMIHPAQSSTSAVRAVFFIDPEFKLRALIYYPLSNGRNMHEILRVIDAFQTSDKHGVATPANWQPGDDVIVPPPKTKEEAEKRLKEGYDCADWFFCKKKL
ncbi:MAG: peroxiredoxin [Candidatus Thorarchaeota archaeon]|nr:MAG: peroxiredoxin [Candidatus Thorarchaeota archaeon]RLI59691.1 MAG: peroxiredoxin [Candidatus Thorarchaeota archaeon]